MITQQKFKYGDHVVDHKGDHGIITAVRFYQSKHFRPDAYTIEYSVDRSPDYEDDDEFWASEVNLKMFHSTENGFEWTEKEKLEGSRCCV